MPAIFLKKLRRPLKAFNRKSILLLVALWVLLVSSSGCTTTPAYLATAFAATTVCIVLWANHLSVAPINRARDVFWIVGIALYDLFLISILVILACIPFSFLGGECYTSRAKVSELVLATSEYRGRINDRFEAQKNLDNIGQGIEIQLSKRVRGGMVTSAGIILLASEDPPAVVFMTPRIEAGALIWKCSGVPQKFMPMSRWMSS